MELYFLQVRLAQQRYRELLLGRDTFGIAGPPVTVKGARDSAYYLQKFREGQLGPTLLAELLRRDRVSAATCPYIYAVLPVGVEPGRTQNQWGTVHGEGGTLVGAPAGTMLTRESSEGRRRRCTKCTIVRPKSAPSPARTSALPMSSESAP